MPLYEYKCDQCDTIVEELRSMKDCNKINRCLECGEKRYLIISKATPRIWKPLTLDHIADEPMTFYSENQLRSYCRKHGLASAALL